MASPEHADSHNLPPALAPYAGVYCLLAAMAQSGPLGPGGSAAGFKGLRLRLGRYSPRLCAASNRLSNGDCVCPVVAL